MKVVLLSLLAVQALSAPVLENGASPVAQKIINEDLVREKRSSYGAPVYAQPPCGAAPISIAPPSTYSLNIPQGYGYHPHPAAYHPHPVAYPSYGIASPQYRADDFEEENEMLSFSDVDHMPMARYGYASAPAHYGASVDELGHVVPSPGAIGIFPNANVGSCAVPLLLSCSPTITHGKLAKSQHSHYGVPASSISLPGAPSSYRDDGHHMPAEPHRESLHPEDIHASHEQHTQSKHDTSQINGMQS